MTINELLTRCWPLGYSHTCSFETSQQIYDIGTTNLYICFINLGIDETKQNVVKVGPEAGKASPYLPVPSPFSCGMYELTGKAQKLKFVYLGSNPCSYVY